MAVDATLWMPNGMDDGEKADHDAAHPGDPHGAAAAAWESWAAQLGAAATDGPEVVSVSTGAQSVTYARGGTSGQALTRAAWHRARAKAEAVALGPQYGVTTEVQYFADDGSNPGDPRPNDESNDALWSGDIP